MQVIRSGDDFTIIPEVHRRTMLWIHGYGDTGELFCQDFAAFPLLADCKVILPTAPITRSQRNATTSWYDRDGKYQYNASMESSAERFLSILREESKHTDCLIIGGFSQGAVMSLYTGLCKYEGNLKAIIALSGFAACPTIRPDKMRVPILWYHGAQDNRIPLALAQETAGRYLSGTNLTFEVHPTMPHEVYGEEYEYIRKWLISIL